MYKRAGFSLLEIMMVLTILSILAAWAYPQYQAMVIRAHRLEAHVALFELAHHMERAYAQKHTYVLNAKQKQNLPTQSNTGYYQLSILAATEETFTLKATPTTAQKDTVCESLTLTNTGIQGITTGPWGDPSGPATQCW